MWRQLSSWAKVFDTHFAPNANLKSIAFDMEVWNHCPLSQFNFIRGFASSGGRNSAGRITAFHRGGGVKRLPRKIDVKRSNSALGIVERIEYDPNRSARIAFVRWVEGVKVRRKQCNVKGEFSPPVKTLEPTTTNIRGLFSFCSMPGKTVQRKVACDSPPTMMGYVAVGVPTTMAPLSNAQSSTASKKNSARDVFMSAFSPGAIISSGKSSVVPRMVVAGAKPPFFSLQTREEVKDKSSFSLSEVQKWRVNSTFWSNRIKRKAAISWQNFRQQLRLGLVKSGEHDEPKSK